MKDIAPFSELGHGAQFKVYDMHDGRVLKIPLTEAETYLVAKRRRNIIHGTIEEIASLDVRVQTFMNSKARIPSIVEHNFVDAHEFYAHLGQPKIIRDQGALPEDTHLKKWGAGRVVYTQSKAEPLAGYLHYLSEIKSLTAADVRHFKRLLTQYVEHIYLLWEFGFADYIFKLGDAGVLPNGNLITMDLGEFTADKNFMMRAVEQKWWHDNINQHKKDFPKMPPSLEPVFTDILDTALTKDELNKRWRAKHICHDCSSNTNLLSAFIAEKVSEIDYVDRL